MTETVIDPTTGMKYEVVEGGSDDPFSKENDGVTSVESRPVEGPSAQPPVNAQPPAGAPADPATTVVPQPSQVPTQEAAPAPDPAPAGPAPAVEGEEPWTEEEREALSKLSSFLNETVETQTTAELRRQQSGYDRTIAKLQRDVGERQAAEAELKQHIRNLQLDKMPPEEKERMQAIFVQEDKSAALEQWQSDLEAYHRDLLTTTYTIEFGPFGVNEEALVECETPEEMEALCLEAKANYYEARANGLVPAAAPSTQVPAPPTAPLGVRANVQPVASAPVSTAQPQQPQVPAGATSPSHVGGGGLPPEGDQLSTEQSPEAFAANLGKLPVETVVLRRK